MSKLSPLRLMLLIVTLNGCVGSLSGIFINVFLFKISSEFYPVFLFHLFSFISWLPAFVAAGWLSKRTNRKTGLIVGNGLLLIFYLQLLLFGDRLSGWIPLAGALYGAGLGFYWLSVNVLSIDLTRPDNRDRFNAVAGTLGSIAQIAVPFAAGWIIAGYPGNLGYRYVFGFAFAFFILSILCTLMLPAYSHPSPMHWRKALDLNKNAAWRKLSASFTALHFRDDVLPVFIWVTIFSFTHSEGKVGSVSLLLTVMSAAVYFWIGRTMKPSRRKSYMLAGTLGYSAALLALLLGAGDGSLLFFAIVGGICSPLFQVPFSTLLIDSIAGLDDNGRYRIELVIAREIAISVGRIACTLCLVLLFRYADITPLLLHLILIVLVAAGILPSILTRNLFAAGQTTKTETSR